MTPHRMTKVTLLILLTAAAVAIGFVLGRGDSDSTGYEAGTAMPSLRILGMIPPFMLTDQSGNAFGLDDLRGQAWVASFIFTRCPAACPMVMSNKVRLRDALRDDATLDAVSLVSFTVDPAHDTAEVLQRYALGMGAAPDRWRFLTGTRDQIWQLSRDGFKLAVADTPDEGQGPITHSSKLVLVDGGGRVRGYYDGLDEGSVKSVVRDLTRLRDAPNPAPPARLGDSRPGNMETRDIVIGPARLRLDGFVSLETTNDESMLTTKPFKFAGDHLRINTDARDGELAVEILEYDNKYHSIDVTPIKGFTRSECIPFKGDKIRHTIAWKQGSKLDSLKGKTIKLKFYLRHAKLYSFQFGN